MSFSKRKGLSPVKVTVQKDGMDDALRHGLWNALHLCIWERIEYDHYSRVFRSSNVYNLFRSYWLYLFKLPLDTLPQSISIALNQVRNHFFGCRWFEAYDFIEFTAQYCPNTIKDSYTHFCNDILRSELSAYRFVDSKLTDITSEEEIESIETAINSTTKYPGAKEHILTALEFLSDRKSPDYRNSIKESISAVESLCVSISDDPKASLGAALNAIERSHKLHPAFKKALSSLYGYTSDSNGIRHALLEESSVSYSDAKFMLVACSAFVNYVLGKSSERN